jgi:tetratricopeptide (TPR) repeat protein
LQDEKLKQEAERRKQYAVQFGGNDSQFLDNIGSGKSTPEPASSLQRPASNLSGSSNLSRTINKPFAGLDTTSARRIQSPPGDDLLAGFNSAAPVDASTHFPPPASLGSARSTPAQFSSRGPTPLPQGSNAFNDDDDMFGLNQLAQIPAPTAAPIATEAEDDILGLLSKPVEEFVRKPEPATEESRPERGRRQQPAEDVNPQAKAVTELVDMGFPADKAAHALATTESGLDVQAAVGYLLNSAHAETKSRQRQERRRSPDEEEPRQRSSARVQAREPSQRRQDEQLNQEKDVSQYASEIGSNLFKSANSLWKQGRKQVQKAVAEFQNEGGDPNVPKWMRDAQAATPGDSDRPSRSKSRTAGTSEGVTDEAMMLEAGSAKPRPGERRQTSESHISRQKQETSNFHDRLPNRNLSHSPSVQQQTHDRLPNRNLSQSPAIQQRSLNLDKQAARLTRQDVEEQTRQAYVSPARRKKATPQPDLFSLEIPDPSPPVARTAAPPRSNNPFLQAASAPKPAPKPRTPPRPKAPPRQIPPVSSSALNSSASYRQKGSEAFKRGDYSGAHEAYSAALSPLPSTHPVTILVLCNRALTNIKVGDPKAAISDADAALAIIGVSRGEGEKIVLGTEGDKDMKELYGKALMRKAEALEHMEKWADAGKVWRDAVEAGVGGSISIQGRNRCEKALGGGNKPATPAARPPARNPPPARPSAMSDLSDSNSADSEAVKRMKAANAAAERADDEKFALTDQVDATLIAWKGSKSDNLRALLGSLDKVLWSEAGWKKVNMGDLVMPNKVKIVYMKAIAKVHPDKVCALATVCSWKAANNRCRFLKQPLRSRR